MRFGYVQNFHYHRIWEMINNYDFKFYNNVLQNDHKGLNKLLKLCQLENIQH